MAEEAEDSSDIMRDKNRPESLPLDLQHNDEYEDYGEPIDTPLARVHGLEDVDTENISISSGSNTSSPMHLRLPGYNSTAELALGALQYLPAPLLILSCFKTVVLANEAMGRLLGLNLLRDKLSGVSPTQILAGKNLSQVGVDLIQDGRITWVTWDSFLEELVSLLL